MQRSSLVRVSIFLTTVAAVWAILTFGTGAEGEALEVGSVAQQDYVADRSATVIDRAETERLQDEARESVPAPRERNEEVEASVLAAVTAVFDDLSALAVGEEETGTAPEIPELPPEEETTTSSTEAGEETETTEAPEPATLTGVMFVDADGDGVFDPDSEETRSDVGLEAITVEVTTHDGTETVQTGADGAWSYEYPGGPAVVVVDTEDSDIPDGYHVGTENTGQLLEDCGSGETCEVGNVGFGAILRPVTEIVDVVASEHSLPPDTTVLYLATVAVDDVVRAALGLPPHLPVIQSAAEDRARVEMSEGIQTGEELRAVRTDVRINPPFVFYPDPDGGPDPEGGLAAGEVVATNLQANFLINEERWEQQQEAAAERVVPEEHEYVEEQTIVNQGDVLTELDIAAISATTTPSIIEQPRGGLVAVVVVLLSLIGLYLATFRPEFWSRPRMVALLGIMIVLAAAAVRGTVAVQETFTWYALPAVTFGFVIAVLFDQRIAILMALAVGVLTAIGTLDTGATVYGMLAALAPIPFVSAVSTRGSFRNAVVLSAVAAAVIAAATSWFFHIGPQEAIVETVGVSVAWAFGVSAFASLLGLAALQFFESAFDVTTTLGLLDLTDRNHEALQMLQEKAFGTFNHSLMVGTLADAGARAIGANALLARAMSYYHDLGKTEHPTFFIENQFGMNNPHDELDPKESARIIRDHVTRGVALARDYNIPTEVTEGIVSHHGDGVMRFFYEKARQLHGDEVNIDDFRHIGHKPRTAESAILMLADSLEAACRAVFQSEEPTPDAIEKVVDRVMDEKMEDGQLSESPLTLGEITKVRRAFLDSLIGHYHQRIAYPNFPGS